MEDEGNTSRNNKLNGIDHEVDSVAIAHYIIRSALTDTLTGEGSSAPKKTEDTQWMNLPGVASPHLSNKFTKTIISKSDHAISEITLDADFAKSLLLSSVSFAQNAKSSNGEQSKSTPMPSRALPTISSCAEDMQTIIVSCIKINETIEESVPDAVTNASAKSSLLPDNVKNNNNLIDNPFLIRNDTTDTRNEVAENRIELTEIVDSAIENVVPNLRNNDVKVHRSIISGKITDFKNSPNLILVPGDSLSSIGSNVCRICMTKGRERLISPCHCKGSMANVHLTCLERWLNQVGRNQCELCGYSYPAIRTPRYTVVQALRLWFGNPRNRSHLQSDCLIFWLLSTVTAGLLAVCIIGTQYFVEGSKMNKIDDGVSHRISETAMDFFMAIVLFGYSLTVYMLWKDHYVLWNRWRRANVNVRLLLSPDSSPVAFVPRAGFHV